MWLIVNMDGIYYFCKCKAVTKSKQNEMERKNISYLVALSLLLANCGFSAMSIVTRLHLHILILIACCIGEDRRNEAEEAIETIPK